MSKKTLILFFNANAYYFGRINDESILVDEPFSKSCLLFKVVSKLLRKIHCPLTRYFYKSWFKCINDFSTIILFDRSCLVDYSLMRNISKYAPNANKVLYSWNMVRDEAELAEQKKLALRYGFKQYSYDQGDCLKYKLNFNTIMYTKSILLPRKEKKYDAFFLGMLKDKKEQICFLYDAMLANGLKAHFTIVDDKVFRLDAETKKLPFDFRSQYVNYFDYLDMLAESESIIDFAQKNQDGLSMRVMEAIFFNKKLITTNVSIKKEFFYDENKIFVLEKDHFDKSALVSFLNKEMIPYAEDVKTYYSIEQWIQRFES